jgi:hypothetical protein
MPTVKQIQTAKKQLRRVIKRPNNAPKIVNRLTYIAMKTDPATLRKKQEIMLRKEMENHKKQYMAALKKLNKIKK